MREKLFRCVTTYTNYVNSANIANWFMTACWSGWKVVIIHTIEMSKTYFYVTDSPFSSVTNTLQLNGLDLRCVLMFCFNRYTQLHRNIRSQVNHILSEFISCTVLLYLKKKEERFFNALYYIIIKGLKNIILNFVADTIISVALDLVN